jgi:hypothetical protein
MSMHIVAIARRLGFLFMVLIPLGMVAAAPATAQGSCNGNEPDSPGLLSDSDYQGPIFGNSVTWNDAWEVGEMSSDYVAEVVGEFYQPVDCEGNTGDRLTLVHRIAPSVVIKVQSYQVGMWTFDDMVAEMDHPGWTANLGLPQGSEVLISGTSGTSLAMVARSADDASHVAYQETYFPEGEEFIMSVTIHMFQPGDGAVAIPAADRDIDIDGMPLFQVFSANDVEVVISATD